MKNAGSTIVQSSDEENESTRESRQCSKFVPSSVEKVSHKKQVNATRPNKEDDSKKEDNKKENSKQHKIRMPQRKGGLQLWQFLYALLEEVDKKHSRLIEWSHNRKELEFRLNDPEAIALWWGFIKHRANMTYERLSRSLRYYYDRGILKKMGGERYLYRFCIDPEDMYKHIGLSDSRPVLKPMPLPVNEWVSSKMIPPQHLEPFYLNPEYMSLGMPHATQLPPPPPYPGYHFQTPQYQGSSQITGYEYFTEHDQSEQSFIFNQPHDSFNICSPHASHDANFVLTAHTTALAVASTSSIPPYISQIKPEQERSLTTTELLSDTDSDSSQHQSSTSFPNLPVRFTSNIQDVFPQYSPEANIHFQYDCNSSTLDSGSGSELDEIIPLLESMEDSDCVPMSICTSPCSITHYTTAARAIDTFQHTSVSSPSTSYIMSPCSQLPLQTSPTHLCGNSNFYESPSPWARDEDTWKIS